MTECSTDSDTDKVSELTNLVKDLCLRIESIETSIRSNPPAQAQIQDSSNQVTNTITRSSNSHEQDLQWEVESIKDRVSRIQLGSTWKMSIQQKEYKNDF